MPNGKPHLPGAPETRVCGGQGCPRPAGVGSAPGERGGCFVFRLGGYVSSPRLRPEGAPRVPGAIPCGRSRFPPSGLRRLRTPSRNPSARRTGPAGGAPPAVFAFVSTLTNEVRSAEGKGSPVPHLPAGPGPGASRAPGFGSGAQRSARVSPRVRYLRARRRERKIKPPTGQETPRVATEAPETSDLARRARALLKPCPGGPGPSLAPVSPGRRVAFGWWWGELCPP